MPLKKAEENPGTLTYWFHARGKGSVPISERTQHSYCLPGLCSPLIWKFNYIITRSRRAFLTVDARLAPAASLWRHHRLLIALKQPFSHWHGVFGVGEQDYPHMSRLKGRKLICNATLLSGAQVISAPPSNLCLRMRTRAFTLSLLVHPLQSELSRAQNVYIYLFYPSLFTSALNKAEVLANCHLFFF